MSTGFNNNSTVSSDILLTYHSSTIRKSDLYCLNPKEWINDQIINFYFEYIKNELVPTVSLIDNSRL